MSKPYLMLQNLGRRISKPMSNPTGTPRGAGIISVE